jgi:hypothetical protein
VHAGTAVDVGRILICQEKYVQARLRSS